MTFVRWRAEARLVGGLFLPTTQHCDFQLRCYVAPIDREATWRRICELRCLPLQDGVADPVVTLGDTIYSSCRLRRVSYATVSDELVDFRIRVERVSDLRQVIDELLPPDSLVFASADEPSAETAAYVLLIRPSFRVTDCDYAPADAGSYVVAWHNEAMVRLEGALDDVLAGACEVWQYIATGGRVFQ